MKRKISIKKAEWVAWFSLFGTFIFGCLVFAISYMNRSLATYLEGWHFLGGTSIWLIVLLHIHQKRLADEESKEIPPKEETDSSLFEEGEKDPFSAHAQLQFFEKWIVPLATLGIGLGFLIGNSLLFHSYLTEGKPPKIVHAPLSSAFLCGFAFFSLLLSKYALGMARQTYWRLLRAGGSYLFVNAFACFLCAIFVAFTHLGIEGPERYLAGFIPIFLAIIGWEMLFNLILDLYRPRLPDQEPHPPYESRILNLCTGSKGFLRTVAHTLDYQFGFKVSETWFYQFLEKTIAPLLLFQLISLYLFNCIVVVRPWEQVVIERFGTPLDKVLNPGIHLKWPWPIEKAYHYPIKRLQTLELGHRAEKEEESGHCRSCLHTKQHFHKEYNFLMAHRRYRNVFLRVEDLKDVEAIARMLKDSKDRVSRYLYEQFSSSTKKLLKKCTLSYIPKELPNQLVEEFNKILTQKSFYTPDRFKEIPLSESLQKRISKPLNDEERMRLNRALLECVYGDKIVSYEAKEHTVPVNLLSIHVWIGFRIKNLAHYMQHSDPKALLEGISYRELTRFLASASMEDILGPRRLESSYILRENIEKNCEQLEPPLGIELVFLTIRGVHPPVPVADAFEAVVGAMEEEKTKVLKAYTEYKKIKPRALAYAEKLKIEARSYKLEKEELAAAEAEAFTNYVKAYKAGGILYLYRKYLRILEQKLQGKRLYLSLIPNTKKEIDIVNLEDLETSMIRMDLSEQQKQEKSK